MKKFLKTFLLSLAIVPVLFVFSACDKNDDKRTSLSASNIVLEFESYEFAGQPVEPEVTVVVGKQTIPSDNYTVEYDNNFIPGTASVIVTANEDSTLIKGSATKTFTIFEHVQEVSSYDELINAIRENSENIRLANNIESQNLQNRDEIYIFAGTSETNAIPKDLNFVLDLNGYVIENPIYIDNCSNGGDFSVSVTVKNGTISVPKTAKSKDYGIKVVGNANMNLILERLTVQAPGHAIVTDSGYLGTTITANECEFGASDDASHIAAYLFADYNYNFNGSTFTGDVAYYVAAGTHTINDCKFYASGEAAESNTTLASAIIIATPTSAEEPQNTISITLNNGIIESHNGFAVEETINGEDEFYPTVSVTLNSVTITSKNCTDKDNAYKLGAEVELTEDGCTYNTYTPPTPETTPPEAEG